MPAASIFRDDFGRADGAPGNPLTGGAWVTSGSPVLLSGKLKLPLATDSAGGDFGVADVHIRFRLTTVTTGGGGICFRSNASAIGTFTDGLRFRIFGGGNYACEKRVSGTDTVEDYVRDSGGQELVAAPGDVIDIHASGTAVTINVHQLAGTQGSFTWDTSPAYTGNTKFFFVGSVNQIQVDDLVVWALPFSDQTFYVSPTGTLAGDGTLDHPIDLQHQLQCLIPGSDIRMLDGIYRPADGNGFQFLSSGTVSARCRLIQDSKGLGKAIIDGYVSGHPILSGQGTLNLLGSKGGNYVDLYGFRVTNSDPTRSDDGVGNGGNGYANDGGVQVADAVATDLFHIISDNHGGNNFSLFGTNEGGVTYSGLYSFNSGNPQGFNGGSGYGIYEQSDPFGTDRKLVYGCILWGAPGDINPYLLHSYAHHGNLKNQDFVDNIFLANPNQGSDYSKYSRWSVPFLWGSFGQPIVGGTFVRNLTLKPFLTKLLGGQGSLGYSEHDNKDIEILDNHLIGGTQVNGFESATIKNNTLVATGTVYGGTDGTHADNVELWDITPQSSGMPLVDPADWTWDGNHYYDNSENSPLTLSGDPTKNENFAVEGESNMAWNVQINGFGPWTTRMGDNGDFHLGLPPAPFIKVVASPYNETGIVGTIGVANYTQDPTLYAPAGTMLEPGDTYAVYHIADLLWDNSGNFTGQPTATGKYSAATPNIALPGMPVKTLQTPVGTGIMAPAAPQSPLPGEIAAYIVVKTGHVDDTSNAASFPANRPHLTFFQRLLKVICRRRR